MKIYLGSDHAGFALKNSIADILRKAGHEVEDLGAHVLDPADDYPDFILPVARAVAADHEARGIVFGMSGQGEAMAANRIKGARAAVYYDICGTSDVPHSDKILTLSRAHNDANILSIGAHFVTEADAKEAIVLWLATPFSAEERHLRRIKKLDSN